MKVEFCKPENDVIYIEDVTVDHIIVAVILGDPCILNNHRGTLEFDIICNTEGGSNLTSGNGYDITGNIKDIKEMITKTIQIWPGCKLQVFEQKDWKSALQFLINNA